MPNTTGLPISRRQLLTGVAAGGLTLSPLMRSVLGQIKQRAKGSASPPLRFVFFIRSSGLWADIIQPQGLEDRLPFKPNYNDAGDLVVGKNANARRGATPPADFQMGDEIALNETMASLKPFTDRISILQGINSGFNVYHKGHYQTLGGFQGRKRDSSEAGTATVDSLLGQANRAPIPHVCLGHDSQSPSGVSYVPTSAEGKGKPIAFYTKPQRAYKELFGVIDDGAAKDAYDVQTDILDFFADDAKRIQAEVAGPEREQLDRYLNAFDTIRRNRKEVEAISEQLRAHAPKPPGEIPIGSPAKIAAANTDIAGAALLSGLTNTVTLRFDQLGSSSYDGIGSMHAGIGHGQVKNMIASRRKLCQIHFEQIARLANMLASVPEGDGVMLDNTVMVYLSDNGESHHSSGANFGVMMLGDLGGRLARRRYYAPGNDEKVDRSKPGYTRLGDVWATLLAAAGQPYTEFGIPVNGIPHQPIEPLLG